MEKPSRTALVFGRSGQELDFYPPEALVCAEGAPTSAALYDVLRWDQANDDTPLVSGTATLDSVATTVNVAAGYSQSAAVGGRERIGLASTSGVRTDRAYLIANVGGQREPVFPAEVQPTYVTSEVALRFDYPITTSTFRALRHSFSVPSNLYGDDTLVRDGSRRWPPCRVRWTWTSPAGVTRESWTYFDLVQQAASHGVTAEKLRAVFPDVTDHEWRESRGQMFRDQIGAAWDRFTTDLALAGYPADALRDGPIVDEIVRSAAILLLAENGVVPRGRDPETFVRDQRERYTSLLERAFLASERPKPWMSGTATGEVSETYARQPILVR